MAGPQPGERAPDFVGTSHLGERVALADHRGRFVVLYFFMKSFSPQCTQQARVFRDNREELEALGASVIGVSIDPIERQCRFAEANRVTFPLIADENRHISVLYGAARPLLPLDRRITFVIDREGIVRMRFQHQFQVSRHLDNVVGALQELVAGVPAGKRVGLPSTGGLPPVLGT